jgi:hypothetical protein
MLGINIIKPSFILFIFIIFSCNGGKESERKIVDNTYNLLSKVIDEYVKPSLIIPPPVPEGVPDTLKRIRDSILNLPNVNEWLNQEHIVAIRPKLFELKEKEYYMSPIKEKEYKEKVENLFLKNETIVSNKSIDITNLRPTRGNIFIEAPTDNDLRLNDKLWESFDLLFTTSEIRFNDSYDKALLVVGISRSSLDGLTKFIFLEKRNDDCEIIYDRILTIS